MSGKVRIRKDKFELKLEEVLSGNAQLRTALMITQVTLKKLTNDELNKFCENTLLTGDELWCAFRDARSANTAIPGYCFGDYVRIFINKIK